MSAAVNNQTAVIAGAVAVLAYVLYKAVPAAAAKAADVAGGVVSGNNAVTQNQTNSAGEKTTAYEGAGILGTLGAVFNSASGGTFASAGEWLGGWAYGDTSTPANTGGATGSW